jgi:hypothetical protein
MTLLSILILTLLLVPVTTLLVGFFVYRQTLYKISKNKTVIAEYQSPKLLTPPEIGFLIDHRFGDNELLATILELNNKKFIKITKLKNDLAVSLTDKKGAHHLASPEIAIIGWLKANKQTEVKFNSLLTKTSGFAGLNSSFRSEVKSDLKQKGYLYGNSNSLFFDRQSRAGKLAFSFSLLTSVFMCFVAYALLTSPFETDLARQSVGNIDSMLTILTIAVCFVPLILLLNLYFRTLAIIYSIPAGYPRDYTDSLVKIWDDVAGFKLFISTVEFSRLDAGVKITDPALPYAVALGYKPKLDKLDV